MERESAVSARAEKARESTGEYVRGAHEGARVEERTFHERHVLARHERRKAVELRVDTLQGSRDSFPVFLFYLGYCANACGKAPVGDKVELYKCCRVFAYSDIPFALCLLLYLTALYMCH